MTVTELEKLKNAAEMIAELSDGRLRMCAGAIGTPHIQPTDDSNIGMDMVIRSDFENQRYTVTFEARIRRMGATMNSDSLRTLQGEVHSAYALLMALEMREFHPSQEDLLALRDHLLRQQEQIVPLQSGPVMG